MNAEPAAGTFERLWFDTVHRRPENGFIAFADSSGRTRTWTYGQFDQLVGRCANSLDHAGAGRGDAIHVVLQNCPAFIGLWLAASRLGAWIVPVDPRGSSRDLSNQIDRVNPKVSVIARERRDVYEKAARTAPTVIELHEDWRDLEDDSPLLTEAIPFLAGDRRADDRLAVMFTSGTTSEPKGVVLTQGCYFDAALRMADAATLKPEHRWYVTLPLFHANAQYYCFAPAIAVGASVALTGTFSASRWVEQARSLDVTHASLFAAPMRMILARTPKDTPPLALQHVWFAQSLGSEHHHDFGQLVGTAPRQLYGMTETVAVVTYDQGERPRHDVIGSPAGREVRVADPLTGRVLTGEDTGELVVRGVRGRSLFAGYLDSPALNARIFDDECDGTSWFHTGDLVRRDDEVLRFMGRLDDVIKVSGENVSLTEVEAVAAQAPGVLEVAVVATPDPIRDLVPVAYYVAADKAYPPSEASLHAWATENLPPAGRPTVWHLIDELPRTSVGKVRRFRLNKENSQ